VVQDQDHPLLLSDAFDVEQMHWIGGLGVSAGPLHCTVKTRYRQRDLECSASRGSGLNWRVNLSQAARAVTPGQYAVFYSGERCLGGGVIARRFNSARGAAVRTIAYNSLISVEGS
jgi:tRNA-specific 2-thiouridylase